MTYRQNRLKKGGRGISRGGIKVISSVRGLLNFYFFYFFVNFLFFTFYLVGGGKLILWQHPAACWRWRQFFVNFLLFLVFFNFLFFYFFLGGRREIDIVTASGCLLGVAAIFCQFFTFYFFYFFLSTFNFLLFTW